MPLLDYQGYTKKLYNVKNTLHERMISKAKKDGIDLSDAVNLAFELYLSGAKAARPAKDKTAAK